VAAREVKARCVGVRAAQSDCCGGLTVVQKWVDDLLPGVPPKTALGKALACTTRQWEKLSRFRLQTSSDYKLLMYVDMRQGHQASTQRQIPLLLLKPLEPIEIFKE
jgi:hypothetical protein